MRKLTALFVLLWAVPAYGTPIEITNGGVSMTQSYHFDVCVSGFGASTCIIGGGSLMPPLPGNTTLDFNRAQAIPKNLILNFVYEPVLWDAVFDPLSTAPIIYEPFTMTGTWNQDTVTGQGMLTCCTSQTPFEYSPRIDVRFNFQSPVILSAQSVGVPEPASVWLMILGGLALLPFSLSRRVP